MLSDPEKRQLYDRFGLEGLEGAVLFFFLQSFCVFLNVFLEQGMGGMPFNPQELFAHIFGDVFGMAEMADMFYHMGMG